MIRVQISPAGDIKRLLEDKANTITLYESLRADGRSILPSTGALGALGGAYLSRRPQDDFIIEQLPGFERLTSAWLWPTGVADVNLSLFLAGVVIARRDVWTSFQGEDQAGIDWVQCLQWLVIHGLRELNLTRFVQPVFAASLRRESIVFGEGMISPLEWIVAREYGADRWEQLLNDRNSLRPMLQDWVADRSEAEMNVFFDGARQRGNRLATSPTTRVAARLSANRFRQPTASTIHPSTRSHEAA